MSERKIFHLVIAAIFFWSTSVVPGSALAQAELGAAGGVNRTTGNNAEGTGTTLGVGNGRILGGTGTGNTYTVRDPFGNGAIKSVDSSTIDVKGPGRVETLYRGGNNDTLSRNPDQVNPLGWGLLGNATPINSSGGNANTGTGGSTDTSTGQDDTSSVRDVTVVVEDAETGGGASVGQGSGQGDGAGDTGFDGWSGQQDEDWGTDATTTSSGGHDAFETLVESQIQVRGREAPAPVRPQRGFPRITLNVYKPIVSAGSRDCDEWGMESIQRYLDEWFERTGGGGDARFHWGWADPNQKTEGVRVHINRLTIFFKCRGDQMVPVAWEGQRSKLAADGSGDVKRKPAGRFSTTAVVRAVPREVGVQAGQAEAEQAAADARLAKLEEDCETLWENLQALRDVIANTDARIKKGKYDNGDQRDMDLENLEQWRQDEQEANEQLKKCEQELGYSVRDDETEGDGTVDTTEAGDESDGDVAGTNPADAANQEASDGANQEATDGASDGADDTVATDGDGDGDTAVEPPAEPDAPQGPPDIALGEEPSCEEVLHALLAVNKTLEAMRDRGAPESEIATWEAYRDRLERLHRQGCKEPGVASPAEGHDGEAVDGAGDDSSTTGSAGSGESSPSDADPSSTSDVAMDGDVDDFFAERDPCDELYERWQELRNWDGVSSMTDEQIDAQEQEIERLEDEYHRRCDPSRPIDQRRSRIGQLRWEDKHEHADEIARLEDEIEQLENGTFEGPLDLEPRGEEEPRDTAAEDTGAPAQEDGGTSVGMDADGAEPTPDPEEPLLGGEPSVAALGEGPCEELAARLQQARAEYDALGPGTPVDVFSTKEAEFERLEEEYKRRCDPVYQRELRIETLRSEDVFGNDDEIARLEDEIEQLENGTFEGELELEPRSEEEGRDEARRTIEAPAEEEGVESSQAEPAEDGTEVAEAPAAEPEPTEAELLDARFEELNERMTQVDPQSDEWSELFAEKLAVHGLRRGLREFSNAAFDFGRSLLGGSGASDEIALADAVDPNAPPPAVLPSDPREVFRQAVDGRLSGNVRSSGFSEDTVNGVVVLLADQLGPDVAMQLVNDALADPVEGPDQVGFLRALLDGAQQTVGEPGAIAAGLFRAQVIAALLREEQGHVERVVDVETVTALQQELDGLVAALSPQLRQQAELARSEERPLDEIRTLTQLLTLAGLPTSEPVDVSHALNRLYGALAFVAGDFFYIAREHSPREIGLLALAVAQAIQALPDTALPAGRERHLLFALGGAFQVASMGFGRASSDAEGDDQHVLAQASDASRRRAIAVQIQLGDSAAALRLAGSGQLLAETIAQLEAAGLVEPGAVRDQRLEALDRWFRDAGNPAEIALSGIELSRAQLAAGDVDAASATLDTALERVPDGDVQNLALLGEQLALDLRLGKLERGDVFDALHAISPELRGPVLTWTFGVLSNAGAAAALEALADRSSVRTASPTAGVELALAAIGAYAASPPSEANDARMNHWLAVGQAALSSLPDAQQANFAVALQQAEQLLGVVGDVRRAIASSQDPTQLIGAARLAQGIGRFDLAGQALDAALDAAGDDPSPTVSQVVDTLALMLGQAAHDGLSSEEAAAVATRFAGLRDRALGLIGGRRAQLWGDVARVEGTIQRGLQQELDPEKTGTEGLKDELQQRDQDLAELRQLARARALLALLEAPADQKYGVANQLLADANERIALFESAVRGHFSGLASAADAPEDHARLHEELGRLSALNAERDAIKLVMIAAGWLDLDDELAAVSTELNGTGQAGRGSNIFQVDLGLRGELTNATGSRRISDLPFVPDDPDHIRDAVFAQHEIDSLEDWRAQVIFAALSAPGEARGRFLQELRDEAELWRARGLNVPEYVRDLTPKGEVEIAAADAQLERVRQLQERWRLTDHYRAYASVRGTDDPKVAFEAIVLMQQAQFSQQLGLYAGFLEAYDFANQDETWFRSSYYVAWTMGDTLDQFGAIQAHMSQVHGALIRAGNTDSPADLSQEDQDLLTARGFIRNGQYAIPDRIDFELAFMQAASGSLDSLSLEHWELLQDRGLIVDGKFELPEGFESPLVTLGDDRVFDGWDISLTDVAVLIATVALPGGTAAHLARGSTGIGVFRSGFYFARALKLGLNSRAGIGWWLRGAPRWLGERAVEAAYFTAFNRTAQVAVDPSLLLVSEYWTPGAVLNEYLHNFAAIATLHGVGAGVQLGSRGLAGRTGLQWTSPLFQSGVQASSMGLQVASLMALHGITSDSPITGDDWLETTVNVFLLNAMHHGVSKVTGRDPVAAERGLVERQNRYRDWAGRNGFGELAEGQGARQAARIADLELPAQGEWAQWQAELEQIGQLRHEAGNQRNRADALERRANEEDSGIPAQARDAMRGRAERFREEANGMERQANELEQALTQEIAGHRGDVTQRLREWLEVEPEAAASDEIIDANLVVGAAEVLAGGGHGGNLAQANAFLQALGRGGGRVRVTDAQFREVRRNVERLRTAENGPTLVAAALNALEALLVPTATVRASAATGSAVDPSSTGAEVWGRVVLALRELNVGTEGHGVVGVVMQPGPDGRLIYVDLGGLPEGVAPRRAGIIDNVIGDQQGLARAIVEGKTFVTADQLYGALEAIRSGHRSGELEIDGRTLSVSVEQAGENTLRVTVTEGEASHTGLIRHVETPGRALSVFAENVPPPSPARVVDAEGSGAPKLDLTPEAEGRLAKNKERVLTFLVNDVLARDAGVAEVLGHLADVPGVRGRELKIRFEQEGDGLGPADAAVYDPAQHAVILSRQLLHVKSQHLAQTLVHELQHAHDSALEPYRGLQGDLSRQNEVRAHEAQALFRDALARRWREHGHELHDQLATGRAAERENALLQDNTFADAYLKTLDIVAEAYAENGRQGLIDYVRTVYGDFFAVDRNLVVARLEQDVQQLGDLVGKLEQLPADEALTPRDQALVESWLDEVYLPEALQGEPAVGLGWLLAHRSALLDAAHFDARSELAAPEGQTGGSGEGAPAGRSAQRVDTGGVGGTWWGAWKSWWSGSDGERRQATAKPVPAIQPEDERAVTAGSIYVPRREAAADAVSGWTPQVWQSVEAPAQTVVPQTTSSVSQFRIEGLVSSDESVAGSVAPVDSNGVGNAAGWTNLNGGVYQGATNGLNTNPVNVGGLQTGVAHVYDVRTGRFVPVDTNAGGSTGRGYVLDTSTPSGANPAPDAALQDANGRSGVPLLGR